MEISVPKEWFGLLDILEKEKGVAIILGTTDMGKTTLAKFLIFNLCKRGLKPALVDADIWQSSISLSSICFVLFGKPYFTSFVIHYFKAPLLPVDKNGKINAISHFLSHRTSKAVNIPIMLGFCPP